MDLEQLPTEILTHIYFSLPTVSSALSLSATCHRLYSIYHSSKRLQILAQAAEAEFGPLDDVVQLLTHNASQPAHLRRDVPVSAALVQQIVKVGRVAQQWEQIYPLKKWKADFASRRLLSQDERFLLRRAIYRLWLFDVAFHNAAHVRTGRGRPEVVRERAALLHNFNTTDLSDMLDLHLVIREVVANNICPSNGKMRHKLRKRFPDGISIHLNYPPTSQPPPDDKYYNSSLANCRYHNPFPPTNLASPWIEDSGWGDDIGHYYVVEDMMKLNPSQILYLRDSCPMKTQVEGYISGIGEWFVNNGETFSETMSFVLRQRGEDMEDMKTAVEEGEAGLLARTEQPEGYM